MDRQTTGERLDRREQPLLEAHDEQAGGRLGLAGGMCVALLAGGAVFVEQARQRQLGRVRRQPVDDHAFDAPLRKAALRRADVLLESPDHHVLERLPPAHLHTAGEPVGIEQLQQRREAVRVAVVRRGRQEEPVLEAPREITDCPRELRLDAVAPAARRRRVMRLVEDEQAAGPHRAEPGPHRIGVARIDQQIVRHEEPAVGHPRIHAEAALATHPTQVGAVEDLEDQTEAILQLSLPLLQHRRRRRDDDRLRLPAQQQFAGDEPCLDGLAEPGVVGDEQVDPRQPQRLAERLHLVSVDPDAGAKRRLQEIGVRGGHAVPAQRVQERREPARVVEAPLGEVRPALFLQDAPVDLVVPEDPQRLTLCVVVGAGERHHGRRAGELRRRDLLDEPTAGADLHQLADLWRSFRERAKLIGLSHHVRVNRTTATAAPILEEPAGRHPGTVLLAACHASCIMLQSPYRDRS